MSFPAAPSKRSLPSPPLRVVLEEPPEPPESSVPPESSDPQESSESSEPPLSKQGDAGMSQQGCRSGSPAFLLQKFGFPELPSQLAKHAGKSPPSLEPSPESSSQSSSLPLSSLSVLLFIPTSRISSSAEPVIELTEP